MAYFRGEMLVLGSVSWFFVGQLLLDGQSQNNVIKVANVLNIASLDFLWRCLKPKCCKWNTCSSVFTWCVALDVSQPILACMVSMWKYMAKHANAQRHWHIISGSKKRPNKLAGLLNDACKGLPTNPQSFVLEKYINQSMETVAALQISTCVFFAKRSSCVWADVFFSDLNLSHTRSI